VEDYRKAIEDYTEALRRNPRTSDAWSNRGNVRWSLGQVESECGRDPLPLYRQAVEDYTEALRLEPNSSGYFTNRGNVYWSMGEAEGARGADPADFYRKAIADCTEALRRYPDSIDARMNLAITYSSMAQAQAARGEDPRALFLKSIEEFLQVLRLRPDDAETHGNLGITYSCLGKAEADRGEDPQGSFGRALSEFGEALKRNPNLVMAWTNQGAVYESLGDLEAARGGSRVPLYERALDSLDQAVRRNPRDWTVHARRGTSLTKLGRFEEAAGAYEKALAIVGEGFPALKEWLAWVRAVAAAPGWRRELATAGKLFQAGAFSEARVLYEKAIPEGEKALMAAQADKERSGSNAGTQEAAPLQAARYDLAGIFAQACAGKVAKRAEAKPLPEEEATQTRKKAVENLRKALELGYSDLAHLRQDADLDPIKELPEFKKLLEEWEEKLAKGKSEGEKK
jgi:tetratricopeptide (TPR) repeat protein